MRALWDDEVPGACDSTLLIAERVQSYADVWTPKDRMPIFPVPDGHDQASWLRHEVAAGLARRFPAAVPQDYVDRAEYEITVICDKGYPSYFLIVADLINYARSVDIRVGPGPWLGGGVAGRLRAGHHQHRPHQVRAAVRALPQPGTRVDARHRHRLRRPPARRDAALRGEQVGQRPGRPGHHLRHHQDQGGTEGFGPRALRAARLRHRRPHHQGAAAADHGQGHPAVGHHRSHATSGTRKPSRSAISSTPTPTCGPSTRRRAGSRVWSATPACTRAR